MGYQVTVTNKGQQFWLRGTTWAAPRARKAGEGEHLGGDLGQLAALNGIEAAGAQWFPVAYLFPAAWIGSAK